MYYSIPWGTAVAKKTLFAFAQDKKLTQKIIQMGVNYLEKEIIYVLLGKKVRSHSVLDLFPQNY